jgi:hypothetical protein
MGVTRVSVAVWPQRPVRIPCPQIAAIIACSARMMIEAAVVGQMFAEPQSNDACVHRECAEIFSDLVQSEHRCRSVAGALDACGGFRETRGRLD